MEYEAWCGSAPPESELKLAKRIGLTGLHVMVNDHSKSRDPRAFSMAPRSRLVETAKRIHGHGLAVHFTTWCMPHAPYLAGLMAQMQDIAWQVGAATIMLDAEEPWINARRPMKYAEAAAMLAEGMLMPWGVTGIGWTSIPKVGPLAAAANYAIPQVYCTAKNTLNPRTAPGGFERRYYDKLGAYHVDMGLAGYSQQGRSGWTKEAFMRAAFEASHGTGAERIVYWALRWLRYKSTAEVLTKLIAERTARAA